MTGKNFIVCISFISTLFIHTSLAQHQITVKPIIGLYLYNSENSMLIMGDENYLLNYGLELSYSNLNLYGYNIQFDYSFIYSSKNNVLQFEIYDPSPNPNPNRFFYSDVSLYLNTLDISVKGNLANLLSYGLGPSFSIVNRSVIVEYSDFTDRLSSFNIGINGLIDMRIPLNDGIKYWYLYGGLKLRYLYGLFYDKGLRNLDNYNQHFVLTNLSVGIGYHF